MNYPRNQQWTNRNLTCKRKENIIKHNQHLGKRRIHLQRTSTSLLSPTEIVPNRTDFNRLPHSNPPFLPSPKLITFSYLPKHNENFEKKGYEKKFIFWFIINKENPSRKQGHINHKYAPFANTPEANSGNSSISSSSRKSLFIYSYMVNVLKTIH